MTFRFSTVFVLVCIFIQSCATFQPQIKDSVDIKKDSDKKVAYTFYVAGGYGNKKADNFTNALDEKLLAELQEAEKNSTLLFMGDNISEEVGQKDKDFKLLDKQIALAKGYKGETLFIHGVNEWKDNDIDDMEEYEDYVEKKKSVDSEFPEKNGCPLEHIVVSDELDIIVVNSYWFISNWDRIQEINKKCTSVNTRRRFAEELEGYINDAQGKNVLIVMHHPIFSNGTYAGHETLKSHLLPVPVLGTLTGEVKDLANLNRDQLDFPRYRYLRILVSSIAQKSDRVTIVSGHEESLQYLEGNGIHQIISGSYGSAKATNRSKGFIHAPGGSLQYEGKYTHGASGFAKITYYDDGSSSVKFITANNQNNAFDVMPPFEKSEDYNLAKITHTKEKKAVIIKDETALDKSGFYKFLWGDRYRSYFNTEVTVPVALLDTLYGGLEVTKKGGGHQSNSLRLVDSQNREYAMRSLKKVALKFLTQKVRGISYDTEEYENTLTEDLVSDFFTTAHPFMQMVINDMAKALDINHSETQLFYVPKQERLGTYNTTYGDELYYIERRPSDEQKKYEGYRRALPDSDGEVTDFESTTDALEKLKEDESYIMDQEAYIRARIFDMLIGDWDRHQDQWRWVEYEKEDSDDKVFIPVARDRDNTFSKFDGIGIPLIKTFSPGTRLWQTYGPKIKSLKWFNAEAHNLDQTLITKHGVATWIEQAKYIQNNLGEEDIDKAFTNLPIEIQDETTAQIKNSLKARLNRIDQYAKEYASYLNKTAVVYGTHKDDLFEITRMPNGKTKIIGKRKLSDEKNKVFYERIFDSKETKRILVYGLNDDDTFVINGEGDTYSKIKIIGGYGKDIYKVENKRKLKVYDWKFEESTFEEKKPSRQLTNLYETNTLHWRYFQEDFNIIMPTLGIRNDDGFFMGLTDTYTIYGLHGDGKDFKQQHTFGGNYYFTFQGFDLSYQGIFANIFPNWNLTLNGYFTNDAYANNFFGFGNDTKNFDDDLSQDFNRTQMQQVKIDAGISYRSLYVKGLFESFNVADDQDRFVTTGVVNPLVFDAQQYAGAEAGISFDSQNAFDFPTKALLFSLAGGYKRNVDISNNEFGYVTFALGGSHQLISSGHLVLGTKAEVKTNIGNNFFYYHAPSIGGDNGLRGFRNERFTGERYFYQTTDLKARIKRFNTSVFPVTLGTYGGFDYGRVWIDNDDSNQWHTSYGGGVWISGADTFSFRLGMFSSDEGVQVQGGFGFEF